MTRPEARRRRAGPLVAALVLAAGCAGSQGPPPIALGAPCAACGMEVRDLRFACEREIGGAWRVYDAIECLVRDTAGDTAPATGTSTVPPRAAADGAGPRPGSGAAWLADYDTQSLHAADSVWVVRGSFASPMGGGLVAFRDRAAADSIAAMTSGRVDRLAAFMADPSGSAR